MKIYKNHSMKEHSNMKIGGIAREYIEIENKNEILEIIDKKENIFILGNGTNTLISDENLETIFVSLKNINYINEIENGIIEVGAGTDFSKFMDYLEEKDYSGLENLAGIPGTIGGLIFMNGGAHGTEIFDKILEVEIIDEEGKLKRLRKEEIKISYRTTEIKEKKWIVMGAIFNFEKGFKKDIVEEYKNKRRKNHPLDEPNLGSTFKNPNGYFSAKLIKESGLQGLKEGGAEVSMIHPNFIVNKNNATFRDILNLVKKVKERVKEKTGVKLEEEIIIVKK